MRAKQLNFESETNREPPISMTGHRLKANNAMLPITNGGVTAHEEIAAHLQSADGVMLGVYQNPGILTAVDRYYVDPMSEIRTQENAVYEMLPYIEKETTDGVPLRAILRHMMGLFQGMHGARAWRRYLSENAHRNESATNVVLAAMSQVRIKMAAVAE